MSLVQRLIIPHKVHKTIEKAQNRSSQLDRLNVKELHTLRGASRNTDFQY